MSSVSTATSYFEIFRQKLYIRGVLGKKNDRAADGRPYSMRKWTRWYVELRGPVLVFWNLLDSQLAAHLEDITAIVDGRVRVGSGEFERTVSHIKNIVLKPNFINITDATCSIIGKLKKRDSVWTLHSSGANRFFMQAVDDRAMNEWVRALRLACFEASKLYEHYTASLVNERHSQSLAAYSSQQRPTEYAVQVRFSGTNEWVPCQMVPSSPQQQQGGASAVPDQISFYTEQQDGRRSLAGVIKSARNIYSIYPDNMELIDSAVIAKLEGDTDIDASLRPSMEDADDEHGGVPSISSSRSHGSYALVIFQSPTEMASAIVEVATNAKLYGRPGCFASDVLPSRDNLYLVLDQIADKSIEIMEPVTARRMLENLASERCVKARNDSRDFGGGLSSASGSTANADAVGGAGAMLTRKPWDSDVESEEDDIVAVSPPKMKKNSSAVSAMPAPAPAPTAQAQLEVNGGGEKQRKQPFRFLHKNKKQQNSNNNNNEGEEAGKYIRRQSKNNRSSAETSITTASSPVRSDSNSNNNQQQPAPVSNPPMIGSPNGAKTSFADEASEAITNLKIVSPPPPQPQSPGQFTNDAITAVVAGKQLAEDSDSDADSDKPLGNISSARNSVAHLQQPNFMQMNRASTVTPGMLGQNQMMALQQQQQMNGMMPNAQSMYGTFPQPATGYMADGNAMAMGVQQHQQQLMQRPMTLMDVAWGNPSPPGGMDNSAAGPLLTMERKVDPIERPTGLVGAIANREQMKSEQKYRDSSSLMRERMMRRNQAMGMSQVGYMNNMQPQTAGGRFAGGGFPASVYGVPPGWNDDTMSMMSGVSGNGLPRGAAPYAQAAPSLSAENLANPYLMQQQQLQLQQMQLQQQQQRVASMYGSGITVPATIPPTVGDDDDVALSSYANGNNQTAAAAAAAARMSMAGGVDMHPLRASMMSGMSSSTPHLAGAGMNGMQSHQFQLQQQQQQMQQMQLQMQLLQQQQQNFSSTMSMYGGVSSGPPPMTHRSSTGNSLSPNGSGGQFNVVHSRQSLASTNSGGSGGSSSGSSHLIMQGRMQSQGSGPGVNTAASASGSGSRWARDSSSTNLRNQAAINKSRKNVRSGGGRGTVNSVYELPGGGGGGSSHSSTRASMAQTYVPPPRTSSSSAQKSRPSGGNTRYSARFAALEDSDNSNEGSEDLDDDDDDEYGSVDNIAKDTRQFFNVFVDKCLDVKPYAWLEFAAAYKAYENFCSRNGIRGKEQASTTQFQSLMNNAEWQLKTKSSGVKAYYNTCLL